MARNGRSRQQQGNGNGNGQRRRKPPKQIGKREWLVGADFDEDTGELGVDREAVAHALVELEPIGHRVGGAFVATPLRQPLGVNEFGMDEYAVLGWHIEHIPNVPAVRPQPRPEPQQRVPAAFTPEDDDFEDLEGWSDEDLAAQQLPEPEDTGPVVRPDEPEVTEDPSRIVVEDGAGIVGAR